MDDVARFSEVGDRYGEQLARGLQLTGETASHFAERRIARVRELSNRLARPVTAVLDFGCGTGASLGPLRRAFPSARIIGYEPAPGLRAIAMAEAHAHEAEVHDTAVLSVANAVDVVYCNGVFHHIPPGDRAGAMSGLARALRSDGIACIWENSPYNPGTRVVMSRIPFDRDAVMLTPRAMRLLQRGVGLRNLSTEYHFVFPRALRFARAVEPSLRALPFGGQYVVVGRQR